MILKQKTKKIKNIMKILCLTLTLQSIKIRIKFNIMSANKIEECKAISTRTIPIPPSTETSKSHSQIHSVSTIRPDMISELHHADRFQGKSLKQILIGEKIGCPYCYHPDKIDKSQVMTICDCGKIHQNCLQTFIRKKYWHKVQRSKQHPNYYRFRCPKCSEKIYFEDNFPQKMVKCSDLSPQQKRILAITVILLSVILATIGALIYVAVISEAVGVKIAMAIIIVLLGGTFAVIIFRKVLLRMFKNKFYYQRKRKDQLSKVVPVPESSTSLHPPVQKKYDTLFDSTSQKKKQTHRYYKYNKKRVEFSQSQQNTTQKASK